MKPLVFLLYTTAVTAFSQPLRLDIYPLPGPPAPVSNVPYPTRTVADTVTAGDTLPLVAKLFDFSYAWIPGFETPDAPVAWQAVPVSGSSPGGELISDHGCCTGFIATRGYTSTWLIATFDSAGTWLSDTIRIYARVDPPPVRLVIEPAPGGVSPYQDNPVLFIHLGPGHSSDLYALYRDQYGNYVAPCTTVEWRVLNPSLVELTDLIDSAGMVTIRMKQDAPSGQTYVLALSCSTCTDTAAVGVVVFQPPSASDVPRLGRNQPLTGMPQSTRYYDLRGKLLVTRQYGTTHRMVVVAEGWTSGKRTITMEDKSSWRTK